MISVKTKSFHLANINHVLSLLIKVLSLLDSENKSTLVFVQNDNPLLHQHKKFAYELVLII